MPPKTSWYSGYFTEHPLYNPRIKVAEAFAPGMKHRKVYCSACFKYNLADLQQKEDAIHMQSTDIALRSPDELHSLLWEVVAAKPKDTAGWHSGRAEYMLQHLLSCPHQTDEVKEEARAAYADMRHISKSGTTVHRIIQDPTMHPSSPSASALAFNERQSTISSPGPSESASRIPSRVPSRASSLSRHASHISGQGQLVTSAPWSSERQALFNVHLIRVIADGNLPLSFVEHPRWRRFCKEFIPEATPPSRTTLTQRILPQELDHWRSRAIANLQGQMVTLQSDGWTGSNNHHYIAFLAITPTQIFCVKVVDTSAERKTAENLLSHTEEVITQLQSYGAIVVAWTTDASGESRKARRLCQLKWIEIIVPDCWAHQINLIVSDYFKAKDPGLLRSQDDATELITWLRGKSYILALLHNIQEATGNQALAVIRAVLTRWTAHYLAYYRLLQLRYPLQSLVNNPVNLDKIRSLGGDARARQKSEGMITLIFNDQFWRNITIMVTHLQPLAIAANLLQATHCRLDQVLIVLAALHYEYSQLSDQDSVLVKNALLSSISHRWEKADQPIYIAAVILNPLIKMGLFASIQQLTLNGVYQIFTKLWTRFTKEDPPLELFIQTKDYFSDKGIFMGFTTFAKSAQRQADLQGNDLSMHELWNGLSFPGSSQNAPIVTLALRIFSVCTNSASCERLFSSFGDILTKKRSRLSAKNLASLAELKLHLQEDEAQSTTRKQRLTQYINAVKQRKQAETQAGEAGEAGASVRPASEDNPSDTDNQPVSTFQQIISNFTEEFTEDIATVPAQQTSTIPLQLLFDFSNPFWSTALEKDKKVLIDEMEIQEMAEGLDAEENERLADIFDQ